MEIFASLEEEPSESLERQMKGAAVELEKEAQRRRRENHGLRIGCRVKAGISFKEICRVADERGFQLIIIGTHGRTGLSLC